MTASCKLPPHLLRVARCLASGKSNKQIAAELHLTYGTVKEYNFKLFRRTKCDDRLTFAMWFIRSGL